jgi:glycosyltransferase involved in cell wall biosynthesis
MKRLLLVTSSYAPVMIADMQRARMLAWDLPALGWEVEVLAPNEELQRKGTIQLDSNRLFNPDVIAHSVAPDEGLLLRLLKIHAIGWCAFRTLYRKGLELLKRGHFDLIYISTAQFNLFCLGRLWWQKTGVPYVLDYHDPWIRRDRYRTTRSSWKRRIDRVLSRFLESFAVHKAAGIVSVSPNYLEQLQSRYPNATALHNGRTMVVPFAAVERDLQNSSRVTRDARRKIVYVGAGGTIMRKSFARICELISNLDRNFIDNVRIELYGTSSDWNPSMPKELELIATECGLHEIVSEEPVYIPYLVAIQKIQAADGLLILGVDDPAYMPSKLFLYALTGKPLLASLHVDSQANEYFRNLPGLGRLIHFDCSEPSPHELETTRAFIEEVVQGRTFNRQNLLASQLSPAAARQHARFFERLLAA